MRRGNTSRKNLNSPVSAEKEILAVVTNVDLGEMLANKPVIHIKCRYLLSKQVLLLHDKECPHTAVYIVEARFRVAGMLCNQSRFRQFKLPPLWTLRQMRERV